MLDSGTFSLAGLARSTRCRSSGSGSPSPPSWHSEDSDGAQRPRARPSAMTTGHVANVRGRETSDREPPRYRTLDGDEVELPLAMDRWVLVPRALARFDPELAWTLDYDDAPEPEGADPRLDFSAGALLVPVERWNEHAALEPNLAPCAGIAPLAATVDTPPRVPPATVAPIAADLRRAGRLPRRCATRPRPRGDRRPGVAGDRLRGRGRRVAVEPSPPHRRPGRQHRPAVGGRRDAARVAGRRGGRPARNAIVGIGALARPGRAHGQRPPPVPGAPADRPAHRTRPPARRFHDARRHH